MNVYATDNLIPPPVSTAALTQRAGVGEDFAHALDAAEVNASDDQARLDLLRKSSEQLVATTFVMPMLAQMRNDPFKSDLFHGGQMEEVFGQRLDTLLAERIVAKSDFSIVDAVYRSVIQRSPALSGSAKGVDTHG